MVAGLSTVQGYEPWIFGVAVAAISWLLVESAARSSSKIKRRKSRQRPVPLTAEALTEYLRTSPTLLTTEVELATGLGVDLATKPRNVVQLRDQALALGIGDLTALDILLKQNEHLILRLAAQFKWDQLHRGDSLRLLFLTLDGALRPQS